MAFYTNELEKRFHHGGGRPMYEDDDYVSHSIDNNYSWSDQVIRVLGLETLGGANQYCFWWRPTIHMYFLATLGGDTAMKKGCLTLG